MYTADEIGEILKTVRDAGLSAPDEMLSAPVVQLQTVCNGVGGESMNPRLRALVSKVYGFATATAAVHDWRYHHSDGSPRARKLADGEFLENGMAELKFRFNWYDWRRWWGERKLVLAYRALEIAGDGDWCIAFRNNVLQINKG